MCWTSWGRALELILWGFRESDQQREMIIKGERDIVVSVAYLQVLKSVGGSLYEDEVVAVSMHCPMNMQPQCPRKPPGCDCITICSTVFKQLLAQFFTPLLCRLGTGCCCRLETPPTLHICNLGVLKQSSS